MYEEYLSTIEQGRRTWSTSVRDLQHDMLRPWDQLPAPRAGSRGNVNICHSYNFAKDVCFVTVACISMCAKSVSR